MKKVIGAALVVLLLPVLSRAQGSNVQSAWRALSEYNSTVEEKKPDIDYLNKAKEKIDLALAHPSTKDDKKALVYAFKIYYAYFRYNLDQEKKKLAATISNKTEAEETAYGQVSMAHFETAGNHLERLSKLDSTGQTWASDLVFDMLGYANEVQNLAIGRFKAKKFDEAKDLFYASYYVHLSTTGKKDTNLMYNAIIAAEKAKKFDTVIVFTKAMKDQKIANAETYVREYFAYNELKDAENAEKTLKEGLALYPNDKNLILNYIDLLLQKGKGEEAMNYMNTAIQKDPKNCSLYLALGGVYADKANPKSPITGRDTTKPKDYEELMKKTEENYKKAVDCNPNAYETNFNLGATYNNWGSWYSNNASGATATEYDKKAKEYWMKSIQYLEKALELQPNDKEVMRNLLRLYRMTEQTEKVGPMQERLKK